MKYLFSFLLFYVSFVIFASAQDGTLDWSFNNNKAQIRHQVNNKQTWFTAMATYPDGKFAIATNTNVYDRTSFNIVRYNSNGTVDKSFGVNGVFSHTHSSSLLYPNRLIALPGNKLMVNAGGFIMLLKNDGTLDASFGTNGQIPAGGFVSAAAFSPKDNTIVFGSGFILANNSTNKIILTIKKVDLNGNLISSFGKNGIDTIRFPDVISDSSQTLSFASIHGMHPLFCDADGYIYYTYRERQTRLGKLRTYIARLDANGARDMLYGNNGGVMIQESNEDLEAAFLCAGNDGSIFLGLLPYMDDVQDPFRRMKKVAKVKPDGTVDQSFGTNGVYTPAADKGSTVVGFACSPARYYLATYSQDKDDTLFFHVQGFDKNMAPDPTFGKNGYFRHFQKAQSSYPGDFMDMKLDVSGNLLLVSRVPESGFLSYIYKVYSSLFPAQIGMTATVPGINIYPNPAGEKISIKLKNLNGNIPVQIFNVEGRKIYEFVPGEMNVLETSGWVKGMYFVRYDDHTEQIVIE